MNIVRYYYYMRIRRRAISDDKKLPATIRSSPLRKRLDEGKFEIYTRPPPRFVGQRFKHVLVQCVGSG